MVIEARRAAPWLEPPCASCPRQPGMPPPAATWAPSRAAAAMRRPQQQRRLRQHRCPRQHSPSSWAAPLLLSLVRRSARRRPKDLRPGSREGWLSRWRGL